MGLWESWRALSLSCYSMPATADQGRQQQVLYVHLYATRRCKATCMIANMLAIVVAHKVSNCICFVGDKRRVTKRSFRCMNTKLHIAHWTWTKHVDWHAVVLIRVHTLLGNMDIQKLAQTRSVQAAINCHACQGLPQSQLHE